MAVKGLRQTNSVITSYRNQLNEEGKVGISNKHRTYIFLKTKKLSVYNNTDFDQSMI